MGPETMEALVAADDRYGEFDLLAQALEGEVDETPEEETLDGYLASFMEDGHLEVVENARENVSELNTNERRQWLRIREGILKHPSVAGRVALLSGRALHEFGEDEAWKSEASCKENTIFVRDGNELKKRKDELKEICNGCPVFDKCNAYTNARSLERGFWAGKTLGDRKETDKPKK